MTRYERLRAYLFELEKYRNKCFTEIKPSDKPKINSEIEKVKTYLYNYDQEMELEKKEVRHGFVVDKRQDVIHKSRLMKDIKQYIELGLVKTMD